jgi:hypothetical protein
MLFGRILQHDDDIPSPELNKAFRRNSYDWQVNTTNMGPTRMFIYKLNYPAELVSHGLPGRNNLHRISSRIARFSRYAQWHEAIWYQRLFQGEIIFRPP